MHASDHAGLRMPAEWEPHEATWLQWPHDHHHAGYQLQLERIWLMMVAALHDHEHVHILVRDEHLRAHVEHQLGYFGIQRRNVELHILPYDDVWPRDNGPTFVLDGDGQVVIINWRFNGWGKRAQHPLDDEVPWRIAERIGLPRQDFPLVMEGGAIEVNGAGSFMGTRSSILNPNRNPDLSQAAVEDMLSSALGVSHFIWLPGLMESEVELTGSFTDQHIDGTARYVDESTVLYNWIDGEEDFRAPILRRQRDDLEDATTSAGDPLALVPVPVPKRLIYKTSAGAKGARDRATATPASYCNFYIANQVVLVPVYGDENDDRALGIIQDHFPKREVLGIECVGLVEFGGMIHCATQQQPKPLA